MTTTTRDWGVGPLVRTSRPVHVHPGKGSGSAVILDWPDELAAEAMGDRLSRLIAYAPNWATGEYLCEQLGEGTRMTVFLNPGQRDIAGNGRAVGFHLGFPPHRITVRLSSGSTA